MSDMKSMFFMHKLIKKYAGDTLKEQMLARKSRNTRLGDNQKKFAGILPEEQLRAISHIDTGKLPSHLEYNSPVKEDNYIKNQYHKRDNLLKEVDVNKFGTNSE